MTEFSTFIMPQLAKVDPTLIIWIVVGIFWFIAQLVNKIKEGQPPPPREGTSPRPQRPPQTVTRRAVEDELKEFLESLTGVEPEKRPPRDATPATSGGMEESLHPAYQELEDRYDQEAPTRMPTPAPPPAPVPSPLPAGLEKDASAYASIADEAYEQLGGIEDIEEIEEMKEMAWEAESGTTYRLMRTQNLMVNLSSIRIPTMRIPLTALSSRPESAAHAPRLHDIKAIRKSIVAHTLLAPPKALRDDLDEMNKA